MTSEDRVVDVVVVGAGIGGLTTAALLAKFGQSVTLVEANKFPGGLLRSYSREGVDCPLGVHYFGACGEGELLRTVFDLLGITGQLGLQRLGQDGPLDRYLYQGSVFDLPGTFDALPDALARRFPRERAAIDAVVQALRAAGAVFEIGGGGARPGGARFDDAMMSAEEYYARLGCSRELIDVIGVPAVWLGSTVAQCPAPLHRMTLASFLLSSWRLGCTGAQLADLYVDRLLGHGGTLVTRSPVQRLLVEQGRAAGVVTGAGTTIRARRVVAAVHPKQVLAWLPDSEQVGERRRRLECLRETRSAICLHALVDARRRPPTPCHLYRIGSERERWPVVFAQVRPSELPGHNLLTLIAAEHYQNWQAWAATRTGKRGRDYRTAKAAVARELLDLAEQFVGGVADARIIDSYTPLSVRDWVGVPEGGLYGVLRTRESMLPMAALQRALLPGLRFVGQSVAAPGLLGVTLGALRVVGDLVGRRELERALAGRAAA